MIEISLTQGYYAIIDDEDFDLVMKHKWHVFKAGKKIYASTNSPRKCGRKKKILLHRLIMQAQVGQEIDHKNADGLDNRKENLRFCTRAENQYNRVGKQKVSRYKGVSLHKKTGLWRMRIEKAGKEQTLYFKDETEAAKAYDEKAKELFGEFARLNFEGA